MYLTEDTDNSNPIHERTDEEILRLSINEPGIFKHILERYQDAFLRKAEAVVRNKEESEDIVQETFTKIYLNAARFEIQEGASFKSWAYKILLNTSFTHYQKRKREHGRMVELDPEFYEVLPDIESQPFEKQELTEYLVSVFVRMPDHLSRVLQLHFVERTPQKEIAELEQVSVGAIKTRIHRAKKEFRKIAATFTS